MAMKKFYLTTPIYYVNNVPHVGHAYTTLAADVIARYYRFKLGKENVFFITGTDEHGANVAQAAAKHDKSPKEYADIVAPRFMEAWKLLNIRYDFFHRTTDPRHEKIVQEVLSKIYKKGYIYEGIYEGWYCIGCEKFLNITDLVDGKCPLHPTREPVFQKEKNYFLKLKELSKIILKKIKEKEYVILPLKRHNEIVNRLKQGVDDISISRAGVSWGIPVPWDPNQTIYVWIDALLFYYTSIKFLSNHNRFWPPDLQLMAKDILWFHSVIWQAILIALNEKLPKTIFAHGFFTIDGQKMSKSLGNIISPEQLVNKYGVDGARYLLLTAYEFGNDGDLSLSKFTSSYNADLANGLGNLVSRVAKLCETSGFVHEISRRSRKFNKTLATSLEKFNFDKALGYIWKSDINWGLKWLDQEINENKPWQITDKKLLYLKLNLYVENILDIAYNLQPFLPQTAEKIFKQFEEHNIKSQPPLFPRIS